VQGFFLFILSRIITLLRLTESAASAIVQLSAFERFGIAVAENR